MTTKKEIQELVNRIEKTNWLVWIQEIENEMVKITYDDYNWYTISGIEVLDSNVSTKIKVKEILEDYFLEK